MLHWQSRHAENRLNTFADLIIVGFCLLCSCLLALGQQRSVPMIVEIILAEFLGCIVAFIVEGAEQLVPPVDHRGVIHMKVLMVVVVEIHRRLPEPDRVDLHTTVVHRVVEEGEEDEKDVGGKPQWNRAQSRHGT